VKRRLKVALDVDGVLADFTKSVLSLVNGECGLRYVPGDVRTWEIFDSLVHVGPLAREGIREIIRSPGFCNRIKPYEGAREGYEKLARVCDLIIVTCPLVGAPTWTFEREAWLERLFGIPREKVRHVHTKEDTHADVLVDDNPRHLAAWLAYWRAHPVRTASAEDVAEDVAPFTVHWTANGTSLPPDLDASYRVGSWDELVAVLT
jgi:5'(3')-deoxyribonucleotidase